MADNEIRLNVTAVESEPLNVCVEQVPMNPVNVENTYKGLDYNLLKNKPSIDGVTLEGDKTTAEVIGFDKEYVDEAILTTNAKIDNVEQDLSDRIESVSSREGYSKEEIDNKVIVIEADIDANADAIQKTRSDFMESDSELQQQINAHAEELTTQKNDIDELGDQVAGIESKIPEGTSDTNPLINRQQLLDEEMDIRSDFNESVSELQTQITAQASAIANKVDVTGDTMTGALNLPELNVSTSEGTLNLSITAGVATIATNNGLDIVSQTKFDTAPTTDDNTTWADALDTSLVRKAQVASAIAEAGGGGSAEVPDNVYTQENLLGGKDIEIVPEPVEGGIDEHTLACWHFDSDNIDVVNGISLGSSVETSFSKFGPGCSPGGGYQSFINLPFGFSSTQDFSFDLWYFRYASNGDGEIGFKDGRGFYYTMWFAINYMGQVQCVHNSTRSEVVATIPQGEWAHLYAHHKAETNTYEYFVNGIKVYSVVDATLFEDRNQFSIASYYTAYKDEVRISNCIRWEEDFTPPTQPYRLAVPTGNFMINFTGKAGQSGKNIGEVYYSQSSLASDNAGALPLFTGETIVSANTIYPDFYSWVESHTELQTTSEEYEIALTTYGECPKYVVSNGSLRLPKLTNYLKMANTTDGITQSGAGLPNITGVSKHSYNTYGGAYQDGAFYPNAIPTSTLNLSGGQGAGVFETLGFDASLSNSIYGNSDTVTPAHTTLYPWVYAYSAGIPASTAQAAEFQNALSGKADTNLGNIPSNYDYVVESKIPTADDSTWYRKYKSGWLEQGGLIANKTTGTFNFLKAFKFTPTLVFTAITVRQGTSYDKELFANSVNETSFTYYNTGATAEGPGGYWIACGQGA